jgi:hypothetical protein
MRSKSPTGLPLPKPIIDRSSRATVLGQITPDRSRTENPENSIHDCSVTTTTPTHGMVSEQIRDDLPLDVGLSVAAAGLILGLSGRPGVPVYDTLDFSDRT